MYVKKNVFMISQSSLTYEKKEKNELNQEFGCR